MKRCKNKVSFISILLMTALVLLSVSALVSEKSTAQASKVTQGSTTLPRLVDFGADKCIPCIMMAPILEELKKEYAGALVVEFVDVWRNPQTARLYGVRGIPTQIFFDANGKEVKRRGGFISKQGILDEFQKLGITLKPAAKKGT